MPKLVHITTVPESLGFVAGQVDYLVDQGWEVAVASSPGPMLNEFGAKHGVHVEPVKMNRAITPVADLDSVARLTDFLLDFAPDVAHSHTPKGGMLGMMAATAALVPVRVYQMRGLLVATATGIKRTLFTNAERTSCTLAHAVVCQSPSLRAYAVEHRIVSREKAMVLGHGSNGVDAEGRFHPDNVRGLDVRAELGIEDDAPVLGYVGRIVGDKGIVELVEAWRTIRKRHPRARLLVVGPFEERDGVPAWVGETLRSDPNVHLFGFVRDLPRYYEAMDFLVLPSHREGFPNVPLEAAAMGIPTITTNAVGCVDAVVDGVTGLRVPVAHVPRLTQAIEAYIDFPTMRREHGAAARERVLRDFRPRDLHCASLELYEHLLGSER